MYPISFLSEDYEAILRKKGVVRLRDPHRPTTDDF